MYGQIVQDIRCLKEWESDPWDEDKMVLRSLESGLIASKDLVVDFDTAKDDGSRQIDEYFEERVKTTQKKIIDRIKQNTRHSFKNPPEKAVKKNRTKNTDAMENKVMINLVQVAQNSALDLQSVMECKLTEAPLSLFHLNGTMKKAKKPKLLDCFSFNVPHEVGNHVSIIDMGLLWRISLPSKEDRETYDGSHFTWKDYAEKCF